MRRSRVAAFCGAACAFLAVTAMADPKPAIKAPPAPPTNIEELKSRIEKVLHDTKTPGVGIALVRKDGTEWIGALGLADVAANKPVTEDTLFRIGSVSKMFVALSALKLQHEGKLDLQDTLKARVPELTFVNPWEETDPVRIVHLLEHTTGWFDMSLREYACELDDQLPLAQGLAVNPSARTSRWRPGTRMAYSNTGPSVAAYVIEKITNQRYEDYVAQNWFKPLRMGTADYFNSPAVQSRLTTNYHKDGKTPFPYWLILLRPAGSINATPKEMVNLVQFFLNRGTFDGVELLLPEAIDRMERPTTTYGAREGMEFGYGLNNYTTIKGGRVWHGHNGGVNGGLTELCYQPETGVGYVFMINSGNGKALGQIGGLLQAYLTRSLPPPELAPPEKSVNPLVRQYAGWYEPINPRMEIQRCQERLLGLTRIKATPTGFLIRTLLGKDQVYVPVNDRLFRQEKEPVARLALISSRAEGTTVQLDRTTLNRVSLWLVRAELLIPMVTLLLALSSVVFALVWLPRKLFGRLKNVKHLSVRALPLLAILSFAVAEVPIVFIGEDVIVKLGRITPWSLTFTFSTAAFALFAVLGLVDALRRRNADIRRLVWWHSLVTSLFLTIVAAYMAYWGVIGYRSWV